MTDSTEKAGTPEHGKADEPGQGKGGFGQHADRYRKRWAETHPEGGKWGDRRPAQEPPAPPAAVDATVDPPDRDAGP